MVLRGAQKVLEEWWTCHPEPLATRESLDSFGNRVLHLYHDELDDFRFEMTVLSKRDSMNCARDTNLPPTGTGAFLLPTRLCDASPFVLNCAEELRRIGIINSNALQTSERICEWLFRNIEYSMGATTLRTSAAEVLESRRGTCQDFAHTMIALCRSTRIPARYVSGFNAGEGAMHAWVETLCDGEWHSFDPTHGRPTRTDCVVVACGRDFRDVSPLRGRFQGTAEVELKTWCKTRIVNNK
jgi:transglutaminase-like putative cysteine protease